jgi:Fic-DOC domain mobile mystery protein B
VTRDASDGATPLDAGEAEGLLAEHLTTRDQLNEWEQQNILEATIWAESRHGPDPLTVDGLRDLHRRMFNETWDWAGTFRTTGKKIGVPPESVWVSLRDLLDDVRFWLENGTFGPREAAARFHHRLVLIHPFVNGNGRWARLAADLLLGKHDETAFDWGENLTDDGGPRTAYIAALRCADTGDYGPLLAFLRIA